MDCSRREFFGFGAGVLMSAALPAFDIEGDSPSRTKINDLLRRPPLKIHGHRIGVGAKKPFKAMHVTDSHLTLCNARENDPRKVELAMRRSVPWRSSQHYLEEAIHHARANRELLLHTGDLIDFVSIGNLENAASVFTDDDWFVCAGNHEYSLYVGEAREDEKYKKISYARVQGLYPNDLTLASRIVNGVNFVSFDDVYLYVPSAVVERFGEEVKKGLPIVLMCHAPLFSPELFESEARRVGADKVRHIAGVPGRSDARTADFVKYLRSEKQVRAVISGHVHRHSVVQFSPTAMQYIGGCGAEGVVSELEFV